MMHSNKMKVEIAVANVSQIIVEKMLQVNPNYFIFNQVRATKIIINNKNKNCNRRKRNITIFIFNN